MTRDEAIELKQSLVWGSFTQELLKFERSDTERLITEKDPNEILRAQERIKAFRACVMLPDNIAERED